MLFTERRRDSSVAHQIASLVVFASPLLTIAANPEILASPAVDVIKNVPSTWDETEFWQVRRSASSLCLPGAKATCGSWR